LRVAGFIPHLDANTDEVTTRVRRPTGPARDAVSARCGGGTCRLDGLVRLAQRLLVLNLQRLRGDQVVHRLPFELNLAVGIHACLNVESRRRRIDYDSQLRPKGRSRGDDRADGNRARREPVLAVLIRPEGELSLRRRLAVVQGPSRAKVVGNEQQHFQTLFLCLRHRKRNREIGHARIDGGRAARVAGSGRNVVRWSGRILACGERICCRRSRGLAGREVLGESSIVQEDEDRNDER